MPTGSTASTWSNEPSRPEGAVLHDPVLGRGGRRAPQWLRDALRALCSRAGLDPRGARLLKFTNNAVFQLERHPVVVRVLGTPELRHRVPKVVRVARWLADHDFPAVRLWPGVSQPVEASGYLATVWETSATTGRRPTGTDLGMLLRKLHELPVPSFRMPHWDPLDDIRRRLTDTDVLSQEDRLFLLDRCSRIRSELDELRMTHDERVVHGDAHLGNVIGSPDGPLLCDFDSTCLGPVEADLVPLPVGLRRFGGRRQSYRQFVRGYGYDVTRWQHYDLLREARELKLVTSALPIVTANPSLRAELFHRVATFRSGDHHAVWTRYGECR